MKTIAMQWREWQVAGFAENGQKTISNNSSNNSQKLIITKLQEEINHKIKRVIISVINLQEKINYKRIIISVINLQEEINNKIKRVIIIAKNLLKGSKIPHSYLNVFQHYVPLSNIKEKNLVSDAGKV